MTRFGASSTAAKIVADKSVAAVIIREQATAFGYMTESEQDVAYELLVKALVAYGAGHTHAECGDVLYELVKLL